MTVRPDWDDPGLVNADVVPVSANPLTICKPIDRTNETDVLIRTFIERLAEQSEELQGERKGSTAEREKDTTE